MKVMMIVSTLAMTVSSFSLAQTSETTCHDYGTGYVCTGTNTYPVENYVRTEQRSSTITGGGGVSAEVSTVCTTFDVYDRYYRTATSLTYYDLNWVYQSTKTTYSISDSSTVTRNYNTWTVFGSNVGCGF